MNKTVERQRKYYEATADTYDASHVEREHVAALYLLAAFIEMNGIRSVLDVGAGTGRAMRFLKDRFPDLLIKGVEPVEALRRRGHAQGIAEKDLIDGDGAALPFPNQSFDLVCEFGVLHHVKFPRQMIGEMLRVARCGVFISDDNHFANGSLSNQITKRLLRRVSLWKLAYWLRTGGKGYGISEGDGLSYAYSVFDDYDYIRDHCRHVHLMNTRGNGADLFRTAQNVALFARK